MNQLPSDFFTPLILKACELIRPKRIILFGSFARGDQGTKSDIDLAFDFEHTNGSWPAFKRWVDEDFATLRFLDLIDLQEAGPVLAQKIQQEGIIIYERKN